MSSRLIRRWQTWAAATAVVGAGLIAVGGWVHTTVVGTPRANPVAVVHAAAERKAADDAAAAEQRRRAEDAAIAQLETEVRMDMQSYFSAPDYPLVGDHIVVHSLSLVRTSDTTYEGMAEMSALGGAVRDVNVHVTADDRNLMWRTDTGALVPLYR